MTSKLQADSIELRYGDRRILTSISLEIESGKIVGLLGKNGSGKTSMLEIIYGIRKAQYVVVRADGNYVKHAYKQKGLMKYLPQKNFIPSGVTVQEALDWYKVDEQLWGRYFPEVGDWKSSKFGQLSGGQRRLVETLLIVACPDTFIMLDEPFSNVMPLYVEKLKQLLKELKNRKGILITDHYYRDVLDLADSVYLLTTDGTLRLLSDPQKQLREYNYIR
jgi:lipopolysaccharide export system ATP-binding protein